MASHQLVGRHGFKRHAIKVHAVHESTCCSARVRFAFYFSLIFTIHAAGARHALRGGRKPALRPWYTYCGTSLTPQTPAWLPGASLGRPTTSHAVPSASRVRAVPSERTGSPQSASPTSTPLPPVFFCVPSQRLPFSAFPLFLLPLLSPFLSCLLPHCVC